MKQTELMRRLEDAQYSFGNDKTLPQDLMSVLRMLTDPVAVHVAMLRGEIAKPDVRCLLHLHGEAALAQYDAGANAMQDHGEHVAALADAWRKRWPDHCKACGGWGQSSYEESHGFKGGGTETITDPCDRVPVSKCHRCGQHDGLTEDDGDGPCSACGWNYDDGEPTP